jgi:hypothetical protein
MDHDRKPIPLAYETPRESIPSSGSWVYAIFFALFGAWLTFLSVQEMFRDELPYVEDILGLVFGVFLLGFGSLGLWINVRYLRRRGKTTDES